MSSIVNIRFKPVEFDGIKKQAAHQSLEKSLTIQAFFRTPGFAIDGKYPTDYLVSQWLSLHTGDLRNGKKSLFSTMLLI